MAKDPAFLFYPNDWLGGTLGMTFEEKGAYIELLMLQFNRGHMTLDMINHTIGHIWDKVKDKFIQDEKKLWYNERLEFEKKKRQEYTKSRRNNKLGKNQYTKKEDNKNGHMIGHMENENENINNNTNKEEKNPKKNKELHKKIADYFGFKEPNNICQLGMIDRFITILEKNNQIKYFKEQFKAYIKFKTLSKQQTHGFGVFLGDKDENYNNGGWCAENWVLKLKQQKQNENKEPKAFI